ncbi:MAG: Crp/Fnr family transcriptional regulator [Archangiaceae bacterium]|nr:Crp/Fnr family transcriptional regulator [Archangiaceae bacterium]
MSEPFAVTPVLDESIFSTHPLLAKLDDEARKLVLRTSTATRYRPGRMVIREGDGPRAFCLLEGAARVFHKQGEKEVLVKLFRAPAFGGEMEVLCDRNYLVNMRTVEASLLMTLDSEVFRHLVNTRGPFAAALCSDLSARLFIATSNERALAFADVDARLADLLLDYASLWGEETDAGVRIGLAMSQDAMSRDLAVSRKAVVQSLLTFKSMGLVDKVDGRYLILRPKDLAQVSWGGLRLSHRLQGRLSSPREPKDK